MPRFDAARLLVVGDAMLDRYWHGDTLRISAEAPIPVVTVDDIEDRPGGAANVALNVTSLGSKATLIAALGTDREADILRNKLESAAIQCSFHRSPGFETITKLRILSRHQQLVRADFEKNLHVDPEAILVRTRQQLKDQDLMILSDYDKGVITDPQVLIAEARGAELPILVDPKFKPFDVYKGATILKPNRLELEHAVGGWLSEDEMVTKCQALIRQLGLQAMLVTRGDKGMTLIQQDGAEAHFPARSREVYDVTGAGDTVIAVLGAALASGETLLDAVGLANLAAGIVVSHSGTAVVSNPELRLELSSERSFDRGLMSSEQISVVVDEARARGERLVFTNGCFDILHAGHVEYLSQAKSLGDRLIVGINDDDSVHRLKGEGRPVNTLERRMTMLAGLESVDWVVPFSQDTPEVLIEALKPDLLVKGGDYSLDQVVGADLVRSYGGEVRVLSLIEECSTSELVEKIRRL